MAPVSSKNIRSLPGIIRYTHIVSVALTTLIWLNIWEREIAKAQRRFKSTELSNADKFQDLLKVPEPHVTVFRLEGKLKSCTQSSLQIFRPGISVLNTFCGCCCILSCTFAQNILIFDRTYSQANVYKNVALILSKFVGLSLKLVYHSNVISLKLGFLGCHIINFHFTWLMKMTGR